MKKNIRLNRTCIIKNLTLFFIFLSYLYFFHFLKQPEQKPIVLALAFLFVLLLVFIKPIFFPRLIILKNSLVVIGIVGWKRICLKDLKEKADIRITGDKKILVYKFGIVSLDVLTKEGQLIILNLFDYNKGRQ